MNFFVVKICSLFSPTAATSSRSDATPGRGAFDAVPCWNRSSYAVAKWRRSEDFACDAVDAANETTAAATSTGAGSCAFVGSDGKFRTWTVRDQYEWRTATM